MEHVDKKENMFIELELHSFYLEIVKGAKVVKDNIYCTFELYLQGSIS